MKETNTAAPAVALAIRVLRYLCLVESARAYQIADKVGISRSSCHCILKTLMTGGFVGFDSRTKAYFLGMALIPLGALAAERDWYIRLARPFLREWVNATQLTILVARLLPDREFLVVETQNSSQVVKVTVSPGQTFPVIVPAIGGAQLAFMPEADAQRMIVSDSRQAPDRETDADVNAFIAELPHIRKRGWAISLSQYYRNANAVAAPVLTGGAVAFVVCSLGSAHDLPAARIHHYGAQIKALADRIATEIDRGLLRGLAV